MKMKIASNTKSNKNKREPMVAPATTPPLIFFFEFIIVELFGLPEMLPSETLLPEMLQREVRKGNPDQR